MNKLEAAIQNYQCSGCVNGPYPDCFVVGQDHACVRHIPGTMMMPHIGCVFLGLPNGFNRLGKCEDMKINIFKSLDGGWDYNKFNVPVWKRLDEHGNTLVRGISPRINKPWIHIFLEDVMDQVDCIEITREDIDSMD